MKKFIVLSAALTLMALSFAGCAGDGGGDARHVEGELADLAAQIYANLGSEVQAPFTMEEKLTEDGTAFVNNVEYFIGAKGIPFSEGLVSEAAIGAIPYSLVLLRMEPDADIEAAKTQIKDGVDLAKWICANATDIVIDNIGDLVLMVMWNDDHSPGLGQAIHESFLGLAD